MRNILILSVLALTGVFSSGCLIFPESMPYVYEGNQVDISSWEVGSETRESILARDTPSAIWEDGNTFIYHWRDSSSGASIVVFGYGTAADSHIGRTWTKRFVLARFDEGGVLQNAWSGNKRSTFSSLMQTVYGPYIRRSNDRKKTKAKADILVRLIIDVDGEVIEKPFDYLKIQKAGFTTVGDYEDVKLKSIKGKYRETGWFVLKADPGDLLYLLILKKKRGKIYLPIYHPPWKVDVPEAPLVYAGTFHYESSEPGSRFVNCDEVLDETSLARQVAAEIYPEEDLTVSLAERHEGPVRIRTPLAWR